MIIIGNIIIFLRECRFRHMEYLCLLHGDHIAICLNFIQHSLLIIHGCRLLDIFIQNITYKESLRNRSSRANNGRFDQRNRSMQKREVQGD